MQPKQQHVSLPSSYNYLLFLPERYETQKQWPTILFLHGSGERGSNLEDVKKHGIAKIVEERSDFPFIAVSPQCPQNQEWSAPLLNTLLDQVLSAYHVDRSQVYLTGLSMGGYGTWSWAEAQPHRFAAIAPVCGGGDRVHASNLKELPAWVFHGALDNVVPLNESAAMVNALKFCNGNVKFTVYRDAGHDCWTQTYNNQALYDWFLQHRQEKTA